MYDTHARIDTSTLSHESSRKWGRSQKNEVERERLYIYYTYIIEAVELDTAARYFFHGF